MKRKLRTQDEVVVISGNDRGKVGKILSFRGSDRVVVAGVNIRKKHLKKSQANPKGQIIDLEVPIHISNIKPSVNEKGVKLRVRSNASGERELYYTDNKKEIQYRPIKKAQISK